GTVKPRAPTANKLPPHRPPSHTARRMHITPDAQLLATAGSDKTVKVWDAATGRLVRTLAIHPDRLALMAVSAGGRRFASAGSDGNVVLWDGITGEVNPTFPAR